jgi:hypothetical protein
MARNDSDVSLEQMHAASIQALTLQISLLKGMSRPLMTCLNLAFNAYQQSKFEVSQEDRAIIKMDLARVVVSQPVRHERHSQMIETFERILQVLTQEASFPGAIKVLDEKDLSMIDSACDLYLRIGLLQYRHIADNLGAFLFDRPAEVLLENSVVCIDRATANPGVYSDLLPFDFFSAFIAHRHVMEVKKSREIVKKASEEGPSL